MNVVKCKNGHFFDGDSYQTCPHCGEAVGTDSSLKVEPERKKFGWGHKSKSDSSQSTEFDEKLSQKEELSRSDVGGKNPTDVIPNNDIEPEKSKKRDVTLDIWQTKSDSSEIENDNYETEELDNSKEIENIDEQESGTNKSSGTLEDEFKRASANSEGKTMSYFSAATAGSDSARSDQISSDPVVGWLVCIGGKHFGESFNISAGKNSIGRSDENKVVLNKDNKISRSKHALITYEPKKRNFYLQPGDSSGLTYLNDDYIEESKRLQERDIIEIGDSKFVFIPLCNETFSWEDYLPKE